MKGNKQAMNDITEPQDTAPKPAPKRTRNILIAAGAVAVLAIGATIAVPQISHATQVSEYHELTEQLTALRADAADAAVTLSASTVLTSAQHTAASKFAANVKALGAAKAPIFTKDQAKSLATAAKDATTALGDAPKLTGEQKDSLDALNAAVKDLREQDSKAAAAAKKEKKDAPVATAPSTYLLVDVDQVRELAFEPATTEPASKVSDAKVTGDVVEAVRAEVSEAETELADLDTAIATQTAAQEKIQETVTGVRPVLAKVAEDTPSRAKEVVKAAPKAGDTGKVTKTAEAAQKAGEQEAVTALQLQTKLTAYADASVAVQKAHADAVAAEEAAAAAAAQAAAAEANYAAPTGEYYDNGNYGGGYDNGGGGGGYDNGGGWAPPAPSGGGAAPAPSAPSGGGGGGGAPAGGDTGGGSGGGCLAPPPGWFPTGGTANGCPTFVPPGGGDTGGW